MVYMHIDIIATIEEHASDFELSKIRFYDLHR